MLMLPELHRQMRDYVVNGEIGDLEALIVADEIPVAQRLSVYRGNVQHALTEALRLTYPVVEKLVGTGFFDHAAAMFIRQQRPASACLNDYGAGFTDFLADFAPAANLRYLPDIARLEWAINESLHAPEMPSLDVARLAALDAAESCRLRLQPHPALRLLRLQYPVDQIWRAISGEDEAALSVIDLTAGLIHLLIFRDRRGVSIRRLTAADWEITQQLCAGETLEAALDNILPANLGDRTRFLAAHLAEGHFVAFSLAQPGGSSRTEPGAGEG